MLALATLTAVLALSPKPALSPGSFVPCPGAPAVSIVTSARTCPALEVSGHIDADGAAIDPAFAAMVPPNELTRFERGDALLTGYTADGRTVFVIPVAANGPFHYYIPLGSQYLQSLARLTLTYGSNVVERTATRHGDPSGEAVLVDDDHILFAWDAQAFPAVRISTGQGQQPIAFSSGTSTFEQFTVATASRRIVATFSDGVRTFTRTYSIFGR